MLCGCLNLFCFMVLKNKLVCETGSVSLKSRCYKADVMVHGVENQHICDRCCVTKKPHCHSAPFLNLSSTKFNSTNSTNSTFQQKNSDFCEFDANLNV